MRKLALTLIICSFLILLAGSSQAVIKLGQPGERFSGKLQAMNVLSDRYKLRINKRIMFILKQDDKHTKDLINKAKSLLHKKVTVTYNKTSNFILSITSFEKENSKQKTCY